MAATTNTVVLADRAEVHKSCRSLEQIANVLNDYCQAADLLASTGKKLAKALKEVQSLKGTSDVIGRSVSVVGHRTLTISLASQRCQCHSRHIRDSGRR